MCIAVPREFIIVCPDYSENRNNRLKKCIFLQSTLTSFVVPDSSINVFPVFLSSLCYFPFPVAQKLYGPDVLPKRTLSHLSPIEKGIIDMQTEEYTVMKDP